MKKMRLVVLMFSMGVVLSSIPSNLTVTEAAQQEQEHVVQNEDEEMGEEMTCSETQSLESEKSEAETVSKIPAQMQPGTVIEYLDDSTYTILSGGEVDETVLSQKELADDAQVIAGINILTSSEADDVIRVPNPEPSAGLRVIYDDEGFIREFEGATYSYTALSEGTTSAVGTYTWGTHYNSLTVKTTQVIGQGRLTTYSDSTGEKNNTLEKGDVATRGDMDNPMHGTTLQVMAQTKTGSYTTCTMTKADNGSLPDAVLDIWKEGVECWGYTYSSSLSIAYGRYTYDR